MKNQKKIIAAGLFFVAAILLILIIPISGADAQSSTTTDETSKGGAAGLVPCGNGSDYADRCTLCHLVVGFDKLIDYGFNILIFVALAALLAAGVLYVISAGDQGMITTAKGIMKNTLFGFAFVLLGWLMVNFTLYVLGGKDSNKDGIPDLGFAQDGDGRWDQFQCISDPAKLPTTDTSVNGGGGDFKGGGASSTEEF